MRKGFTKVSNNIVLNTEIPLKLRGFYGILRSFCDGKTGLNCFPSEALLATIAGHHIRTIKRYIKALEHAGAIVVKRKIGGGNRYYFPTAGDTNATSQPVTPVSLTGDSSRQKPVTAVSPYQDVNKNYYQTRRQLFHGNDPCKINGDESIIIFVQTEKCWKPYGGYDEPSFRYGDLSGTEARHAAVEDAKRRWGNNSP